MDEYKILKKSIPKVELVSLTSQNWYDSEHKIFPWSGTSIGTYIGPNINDIVWNITGGTVIDGYYKWSGLMWEKITKTEAYEDFFLPIFLESTIDDLGVMVGFNGDIEQVEQLCNFTYSGNTGSNMITISNSVNSDKLRTIVEQNFTIDWGDGTTGEIGSIDFSQTGHTYTDVPSNGRTYEVSIYLKSPWTTEKLTKSIRIPIKDTGTINNQFGTFTGFTIFKDYFSQEYINELNYTTSETIYPSTYTGFTYVAIGGSRLDEKILYGQTEPDPNQYEIVYDDNLKQNYTGYTIDGFYYRDYPDKYTMITGRTDNVTKEEFFEKRLTRNEHFIGFIDEPTIYSDIFVERGKQGVMEKNLRLSEINNIGEIELYGNGYFNVRKQ